jgi:hypothetical protein
MPTTIEQQRRDAAHQIAGDDHAKPRPYPIDERSGQWTEQHQRQHAGHQHQPRHRRRPRRLGGPEDHRDGERLVAELADDLGLPEQDKVLIQQPWRRVDARR